MLIKPGFLPDSDGTTRQVDIDREIHLKLRTFFGNWPFHPVVLFCTVFFSCSPYSSYIRVNPLLQKCIDAIDTIVVFTDAAVAVDNGKGYYSEQSSSTLDSLIFQGVRESLTQKGYVVRQLYPIFLGSFEDSTLPVPVKPSGEHLVHTTRRPCLLQNKLSTNQRGALRRTCRRLFLKTVFGTCPEPLLPISNPAVGADLQTVQKIIGHDHVLFVFHQTMVVNPDGAGGVLIGSIVLSTVLSGGLFTVGIMPKSTPHTYIALLQLSTGRILWSDYSSQTAVPEYLLYRIATNPDKPVTAFIKPDSLHNEITRRWSRGNLRGFPDKNGNSIVATYESSGYPSQFYFLHPPENFVELLNQDLLNLIDSTVITHSLSDESRIAIPSDPARLSPGKGRSQKDITSSLTALNRYLQYLYYSRLRFRGDLHGSATMQFFIMPDGHATKISLLESTLNDPVFEYGIYTVIRKVNFGKSSAAVGPTFVTKTFDFQREE